MKTTTYKTTEIGLIPEYWEVLPLQEYFNYISYGFTNPMPTTNDGIWMITANDIKNGKVNYDSARKTSVEAFNKLLTNKSRPKKGDLLLTKDGSLGRVAIVEDKTICINQSVAVIRPNERIDVKYLKHLLQDDYYQKTMIDNAGGSTIKHIYITIVNKMLIAVPPLHEQQAIAEALSDADVWIESLEQLIAKKRLLKQGAMQELLNPKEDWVLSNLQDIVLQNGLIRGPFGGALKKEFFVKDGFKVYEQKNAIYKSVDLGKYYIDNVKFAELSRFEVKANDFILSCSGTIGKLFRIPNSFKKGVINQALLIIRLNVEKVDLDYFNHIFQYDTIQSKIIDDTQGGAMKNLVGMSEFKLTQIPLPPSLEGQTRIAAILSDMDNELEALEKQLEKARQIKQGMMQELLTGRVRLV